jgi:pyruvate/2-oxoglutarate dehydrogenase complex dihydrolipoamide acyltransferase (E2) component
LRTHACACGADSWREESIVTSVRVPKTGGIPTTKVIVIKWLKQVGDAIQSGEPIVELQTDKVNYELDAPAGGVLLAIVAQEDSEVPVGDLLGHIGQPGDVIPQS